MLKEVKELCQLQVLARRGDSNETCPSSRGKASLFTIMHTFERLTLTLVQVMTNEVGWKKGADTFQTDLWGWREQGSSWECRQP